ncbi:hypothetical protein DVT68_10560 [Dyella solisilvae]|uniref:Uncharacterized protein n=1 Tax=Dyella solisilvae TaxID=1920168 RepID=A0A370K8G6_9GAMM|nr:hypothetical protein [Dyella solisilvae]RDI98929.1 hypothetical protein DVT68_10560 [Dyella solisilvae]
MTVNLTSADKKTVYSVSVVPVESNVSYLVSGQNDFFSENDLSIERLANSRIPKTASNTFTDETESRVKTISSIVGSVVSAFGAAAAAAPGHEPAKVPATDQYTCSPVEEITVASSSSTASAPETWTGVTRVKDANNKEKDCMTVTIVKPSLTPNLVPISKLAAIMEHGDSDISKVWFVPACMTVEITIQQGDATSPNANNSVATGTMTLIDPDYVEPLPLPKKGHIAMHPICSADLVDTNTDKYQSTFDTITAIAAAVPAKSGNQTTSTTKAAAPAPAPAKPAPAAGAKAGSP